MHVTRFLSGLPPTFDSVRTQILGSKEIPSLSEVFGRLRQASISESNSIPLPSTKKSAFATDFGGGRFSRGGCGGRGRGRGHSPRKCTYCHGENHIVEYYWKLHGKPSTHQVSL